MFRLPIEWSREQTKVNSHGAALYRPEVSNLAAAFLLDIGTQNKHIL